MALFGGVVAGCAPRAPAAPTRTMLHSLVEGRAVVEPPLADAALRPQPSVRLAYSLSRVRARFTGPSLDVTLEDLGRPGSGGNRLAVTVDGVALPALTLVPGPPRRLRLVTHLAGGPGQVHEISLIKLTEPEVGDVRFFGFAVGAGGRLLPPPLPATRRLWVIGDSITCGYGNVGLGPHCPFSPATEDATLSYAGLLARRLGASAEVVAYSGRGLLQNRDNSQVGVLPQLFGQALPSLPDVAQTFVPAAAPQAIVVNLGTNDAAAVRPLDAEAFAAAWTQFLARLRALAPDATIVVAIGPMLSNAEPKHPRALDQVRAAVAGALAARRALGDARLLQVDLPVQDGQLGYGCDYHPSVATHAQVAAHLADVLGRTLHWSQDAQFGRPGQMP